ncbi:hypothetical protein CF326_g9342, partial [Tilletia indica]
RLFSSSSNTVPPALQSGELWLRPGYIVYHARGERPTFHLPLDPTAVRTLDEWIHTDKLLPFQEWIQASGAYLVLLEKATSSGHREASVYAHHVLRIASTVHGGNWDIFREYDFRVRSQQAAARRTRSRIGFDIRQLNQQQLGLAAGAVRSDGGTVAIIDITGALATPWARLVSSPYPDRARIAHAWHAPAAAPVGPPPPQAGSTSSSSQSPKPLPQIRHHGVPFAAPGPVRTGGRTAFLRRIRSSAALDGDGSFKGKRSKFASTTTAMSLVPRPDLAQALSRQRTALSVTTVLVVAVAIAQSRWCVDRPFRRCLPRHPTSKRVHSLFPRHRFSPFRNPLTEQPFLPQTQAPSLLQPEVAVPLNFLAPFSSFGLPFLHHQPLLATASTTEHSRSKTVADAYATVVTPLVHQEWLDGIAELPGHLQQEYADIPEQIRSGFWLGLPSTPAFTFHPENRYSDEEEPVVLDWITKEVTAGRAFGPFSDAEMAAVGSWRSAPLSVIHTPATEEKPEKNRIVEDLGHPRFQRLRPTSSQSLLALQFPSVNSLVPDNTFFCRWFSIPAQMEL